MKYIRKDNVIYKVRKIEYKKVYTINGGLFGIEEVEEVFKIDNRFYTLKDLRILHNKVTVVLQRKMEGKL